MEQLLVSVRFVTMAVLQVFIGMDHVQLQRCRHVYPAHP